MNIDHALKKSDVSRKTMEVVTINKRNMSSFHRVVDAQIGERVQIRR